MPSKEDPSNDRLPLREALAHELQPKRLAPGLAAGAVVALLNIFVSISFAALIFSDDLSDYVANGIGLLLAGAAVSSILIALFSTLPGSVGGNQSITAAIMVAISSGMISSIPASELKESLLPTIVVTMALTGLLFGLFCLLLAYFDIGNLMRFLPYSVVGGFLAGMGWLLVVGALGLMVDFTPTMNNVVELLNPPAIAHWLPGFLFALALIFLLDHVDSYLVLPVMIIGAIGLFHIVAWVDGSSISQLRDGGWLLGQMPTANLWQPVPLASISLANWGAIWSQLPKLGTLLLLSTVSLLLNASGLEAVTQRDVSLSRELKANGLANLGISLFGGMTGYLHLSFSTISINIGGANRLSGLISAALCLLVLAVGTSSVFLLPKMVMGGLLLFLGLSFLKAWVYDTWSRLSRLEYLTILIIMGVISAVGLLEGIIVGVVAAVIFFIITYSRIDVIRHELTGQQLKSRVTRSTRVRQRLYEEGRCLYALSLQGYVFFGTADRLNRKVREQLDPVNGPIPRFILLDFARVDGLDATATSGLQKLKRLIVNHQSVMMITGAEEICNQLQRGGLEPNSYVRYFDNLDQGLEWYEDELLRRLGMPVASEPTNLLQQLQASTYKIPELEKLLSFFECLETEEGQYLMMEGDKPDCLYLIESGQVTAQLEYADRPPLRLESMGSGRVVGEIGFYLGQKRTASVVVDKPGVVYRLTRPLLATIEREDPSAAAALHQLITNLLAQRATHLISTVSGLER